MEEKLSIDFWNSWIPEIKSVCENSKTLCLAIFSDTGDLLAVNDAMSLLFLDSPKESLVNPDFETISKIDSVVIPLFEGITTMSRVIPNSARKGHTANLFYDSSPTSEMREKIYESG